MQTAKQIILWLAFIVASFLPASALTSTASENRIWEIFSTGYDAPLAEATDLESRTETSTLDYDTAPIHSAATEEIPTEANRTLFGQNAEFKAAKGMTADQQALKDLVDEATNGGRKALTKDQAETVLDMAKETNYPGVRAKAGDVANPSNWDANPVPHIHVPGAGRNGHVPVEPGVTPR